MSAVSDASGKLVLLGEYAVVDGGTALVLAVAHGVRCTVHPAAVRSVETPTGDDRFVTAALDAVGAPPARYVFTDREPLDTRSKPGFGGSAAAVVAALRAGGFAGSIDALVALGIHVHRAVQGSGSGVDVAAAAYGGGLRFRDGSCARQALPTPVVVYSGQSAKTGPRVDAWRAWPGRAAFVAESDALVEAFADDPVAATRAAWRLLCGMAEAAGIAYRTPAIDRIVALAEGMGGAAKPSGAGGGDSVVAFVPDPAGFAARVASDGLDVLPVRTDPPRA
ncbi:MAG: hypothetical protein H6737_26185 [Alphaproteobacteria bacterium]|nr:hypothetical protein [Alphaproteobacteria bacterium]